MPRTLHVQPHLSREDLEQRYLSCQNLSERERLHCVLLKLHGWDSQDIARIFLKRPEWVRRTVRRYNREGPEAMKDGRRKNGAKPLLDEAGLTALEEALKQPPPEGGLWSGPKAARWIADRTGVEVTNHAGWKYLKRLDFDILRPGSRAAREKMR